MIEKIGQIAPQKVETKDTNDSKAQSKDDFSKLLTQTTDSVKEKSQKSQKAKKTDSKVDSTETDDTMENKNVKVCEENVALESMPREITVPSDVLNVVNVAKVEDNSLLQKASDETVSSVEVKVSALQTESTDAQKGASEQINPALIEQGQEQDTAINTPIKANTQTQIKQAKPQSSTVNSAKQNNQFVEKQDVPLTKEVKVQENDVVLNSEVEVVKEANAHETNFTKEAITTNVEQNVKPEQAAISEQKAELVDKVVPIKHENTEQIENTEHLGNTEHIENTEHLGNTEKTENSKITSEVGTVSTNKVEHTSFEDFVENVSSDFEGKTKEVVNQVLKQVDSNLSKGKMEFEFNLYPKELGKIAVKMAVKEGILVVDIAASNVKSQSIIASNADQIKSILQSQLTEQQSQFVDASSETNTSDYLQQEHHNQNANQQGQQNQPNQNSDDSKKQFTADFLSVMKMVSEFKNLESW